MTEMMTMETAAMRTVSLSQGGLAPANPVSELFAETAAL